MIQDCSVDPKRLTMMHECMGMDIEHDSLHEYDWNVISRKAVIYSCGMICREGDRLVHNHDPDELELCRSFSAEVANILSNCCLTTDEDTHEFVPFYVTANLNDAVPAIVTEKIVRSAFGNTIYSGVEILVKPLEEAAHNFYDDHLTSFHSLINAFARHPKISHPVFVEIGNTIVSDSEDTGSGCFFPRLIIGVSNSGSLIGVFTYVTHT